ncbi:MAG: DUF4838 domain-containing protein [Phycisphaerae bacterium]|nr:DUF4838 domain-containing protein [Phycisphaerae bacterium]
MADAQPRTVIVIPNEPLEVVQAAAEELQYHIQKATGATLPIAKESQKPEAKGYVYLGSTQAAKQAALLKRFKPNAFVIKTAGDTLYIAGDDSAGKVFGLLSANTTRVGTLLGVYEFLETKLGVRWLWPGEVGEVIPHRETIRVEDFMQTGGTRLINSRFRDGRNMNLKAGWTNDANRLKFLNEQSRWLRRHRFAIVEDDTSGHAYTRYWKRFGITHPEYFNQLPDGTRRPEGYSGNISMCVSQPKLWKQIVRQWRQSRQKGSARRSLLCIAENDTSGKCTCPNCMAWDAPDPDLKFPYHQRLERARKAFMEKDPDWVKYLGSLSDRYAKFYLEVQKEARKYDPKIKVLAYAYGNYRKPPIKTKLNDGIIIKNVPGISFSAPAETWTKFQDNWKDWRQTGCIQVLRPNYTLTGHNMPINYAKTFGKHFAFVAREGLYGTDFDSLTGQYAAQGLSLYTIARMNHRPDLPVEAILKEYYDGFGPAADAIKAYWDFWQDLPRELTSTKRNAIRARKKIPHSQWRQTYWRKFVLFTPELFTPERFELGYALLEKARTAAGEDKRVLAKIDFLKKGLRHAELTVQAQKAVDQYQYFKTGDIHSIVAAVKQLDAYRRRIEHHGISNMGLLRASEALFWPFADIEVAEKSAKPLPEVWKFKWDPEDQGLQDGWAAREYDDEVWDSIRTDAPWELQPIGEAWKRAHGQDYDGYAWYRTSFTIEPGESSDRKRKVFLIFGAVDEACVIWVNGQKVLDRPFPYQDNRNSWREPFTVEITPYVVAGENSLAVRVEDRGGQGGIFKPVWLSVMNEGK